MLGLTLVKRILEGIWSARYYALSVQFHSVASALSYTSKEDRDGSVELGPFQS
jgi:hypothetical protein